MAYRSVRAVVRGENGGVVVLGLRDGTTEALAFDPEIRPTIVRALRTGRLQLVTIENEVVIALLDA